LRQAYDYWQDQPGSYRRRRRRRRRRRGPTEFSSAGPTHARTASSSSHVRRSPHGRGARVALVRTHVDAALNVRTEAPGRAALRRQKPTRGPDRGRPFLSPSRHPLRGRNTQDRQARNEPTRVAHRSDLDRQTTLNKGSQPTRRLPDRWHAGPGRSRASSRLPRSAAEFADRKRTEVAHRSTSSKQTGRQTETQTPTRPDARLRRAVFVRCTAASRIKQCTVRQAIFIPNHRVCTLCTGFRRPILPPYRITSSATRQPLCVRVRVRVPVCASARVRVRLSVCLRVRVRVSVCACLRLAV
jgi:hypothetical protein